jgi:hypothetical protein
MVPMRDEPLARPAIAQVDEVDAVYTVLGIIAIAG